MNKLRVSEQARRLWLDSVAFNLYFISSKNRNCIIEEIANKSLEAFNAIQQDKFRVAQKRMAELLAVSTQFKTSKEKEALAFLRLCNLAGEVSRSLK